MKHFILSLIRLPLELVYWFVDLLRVSRFVFSANEKVTRRCPFGCYDADSIIKNNIRRCKSADRYYNFWLFRTLCRCAERPTTPIPGITAFCRERGSFEITFARWCVIILVTVSMIAGITAFTTMGIAGKVFTALLKDANRTTLQTVRQIAKPKPVRNRPKVPPKKQTPAKPIAMDKIPVATSAATQATAVTHAFIKPESPAVMLRIARGYVAIGLPAQGLKALEECRSSTPDFVPATLTAVLYACQSNNPQPAKAWLQPFLKAENVPPEIVIARALIAHTEGDSAAANKLLNSINESTANASTSQLVSAIVNGSSVSADTLRQLATAFPDLPIYLKKLLLTGEKEAMLDRVKTIALTPSIPAQLPGVAARVLWDNGFKNQAATSAAAIVQVNPADLNAQWINASVYLKGGAADKAAAIASAAIPLAATPTDATELLRLKAQALHQAKRLNEAITAYEALLRLVPDEAATNAIRDVKKELNAAP